MRLLSTRPRCRCGVLWVRKSPSNLVDPAQSTSRQQARHRRHHDHGVKASAPIIDCLQGSNKLEDCQEGGTNSPRPVVLFYKLNEKAWWFNNQIILDGVALVLTPSPYAMIVSVLSSGTCLRCTRCSPLFRPSRRSEFRFRVHPCRLHRASSAHRRPVKWGDQGEDVWAISRRWIICGQSFSCDCLCSVHFGS